ncbi:MAG: cephalosporin hydroxylase family protein [Methanospirillaceae archaeon]|nr:cephalosporin hydroxylase family protein [Methanospirillaceae archaeon]
MDPHIFQIECNERIGNNALDVKLQQSAKGFVDNSIRTKYTYNFSWLGRPIIQYPQDIIAVQEIIWSVQPDLIIETGIAHGGSLIFSASILELLSLCGGSPDAEVIGIDIEIRSHNRKAIEEHPMFRRISMIEGDSTADDVIAQVQERAKNHRKVLVCLDSNHTHEHVLRELRAYAPLVTKGSYCVVFDTLIEMMPEGSFPDRPWDVGNNPWTAVQEYLKERDRFEIDKDIPNKLLITVAPDGYLKCIRD